MKRPGDPVPVRTIDREEMARAMAAKEDSDLLLAELQRRDLEISRLRARADRLMAALVRIARGDTEEPGLPAEFGGHGMRIAYVALGLPQGVSMTKEIEAVDELAARLRVGSPPKID